LSNKQKDRQQQLRFAVAPVAGIEVRDPSANSDGSWTISGYAAVFDQETTLYDGAYSQVRESIAPGAFDEVLRSRPLVHLNFGHDMNRAIASTDVPAPQIGSLTLATDARGLKFFAKVDRNDPDAQALAVKMSRGVARQASFAFTIGAEDPPVMQAGADGRQVETLRITQVKSLMDVCVTPQGAYPQTVATLRSLGGMVRTLPGDLTGGDGPPAVAPLAPNTGGPLDVPTADAEDAAEPVESFAADVQEAICCLTDLLGEYPAELAALTALAEPGEPPSSMAEEVSELVVQLAMILADPGHGASAGPSMVMAYTAGRADHLERAHALARLQAHARSVMIFKEIA
jgi:HK97 family phage prohead protease